LVLISGGSALTPATVDGVTLAEKQSLTKALLACGADIREMNTLRKHISRIKGGQLARAAAPARVFTLILSDIVGDPLDANASGPTVPDLTTYADAWAILDNIASARRFRPASEHTPGRRRRENLGDSQTR
jgi:glycerate-2-kinase